jgi:hypothetical protein
MQTTLRWAEWAEGIVERWPDTALNVSMAAEAKNLLRTNADVLETMAALGTREREASPGSGLVKRRSRERGR